VKSLRYDVQPRSVVLLALALRPDGTSSTVVVQ
jgi:hypothetical protein